MLEQALSELGPWQADPAGDDRGRARAVGDAAGKTLGCVRQLPPPRARWQRWLTRRTVEVHADPDASLIFTLRQAWGWPAGWHLLDADDMHVGVLRGRALLDSLGHLLAVVETPDAQGQGRFLAHDGHVLGGYHQQQGGTRVVFAAALNGNPFARMLLLAGALAREV